VGSKVRRGSASDCLLGQASLPRILVDQPVHAGPADHFSVGRRREHGGPTRLSQLQAAMRSVPVVMLDVLSQDRLGVPPVHDQQPVQHSRRTLETQRSHRAFESAFNYSS